MSTIKTKPPKDVIDRLADSWLVVERRLTRHAPNAPAARQPSPHQMQQDGIAQERAERKRRKQMQAELTDEAWYYIDRIIAVTERMPELSYRYRKTEREAFDSRVSTIKFSHVVMQPEAIYLRLDTVHMPRGVSCSKLADPDSLLNMSLACQHRVLCEYDEQRAERGFWYIIERSVGVRGIPVHVRLDEMWSMRGPTHDGLSIPIGIGENKRPVWRSLNQMLSLLIAGTPGSGKSNMLNVAICTWIRFNAPHRVKLALVDMKGGLEFGRYAEIPHLMRYRPLPLHKDEPLEPEDEGVSPEQETPLILSDDASELDDGMQPALVERREDVLPLFRAIYREGRRRIRLLRQAGERDIGAYNWRHRNKALPHLVIIMDEMAELRLLGQKEYENVMKLTSSIAQLFRAVGIHLVPATQTPNKQVINLALKNAIPGRIAFSCPSVTASTLIIGNGRAAGLSPTGRCVLDWNGKQIEIQTPLILDRMVEQVIQGAIRGEYEEYELRRHDVTDEELFKVALAEFAGALPADQLYRWFNNHQRKIPRQEVRETIAHHLGKEVMIGSNVYRVQAGAGGRPPSLVVVEDTNRLDKEPKGAQQ